VTLSFIAADSGNGSYAPAPVTLPSTGGNPTKATVTVTANKWKWLQVQVQTQDAGMQMYLDGFAGNVMQWDSTTKYRLVQFFEPSGGGGSQG
jgi:hypothetical protein